MVDFLIFLGCVYGVYKILCFATNYILSSKWFTTTFNYNIGSSISGNTAFIGSVHSVTINGKTYNGDGKNITVKDGSIIVDGKQVDHISSSPINITVSGNSGNIETGQGDITIQGDVQGDVKTGQGDVKCGNVNGSVKTGMGDVNMRNGDRR